MQDEDPAALADGEEEVWHDACESHELEPAGHAVDGPARPSQPLDADGALPAHPLPASLRAAAVGSLRERVLASPGADACAELEDRSPATLERFLRARDFNVDVSLALFLDHRAWRQSFGWAVPAAAVPAREFAQHKVAIQALSRDHRHPLLLLVARNHDPHGRVVEDIKRFVVHTLDRVCDHLTPGGQFVVLVDFVGMTSKARRVPPPGRVGTRVCADVRPPARRARPRPSERGRQDAARVLRHPAEAVRGAGEVHVVLQPAHPLLGALERGAPLRGR